MSKKRAVSACFIAIVLLVAGLLGGGLTFITPEKVQAAAPIVSNGEVAIFGQSGIYSVTFKLGSLVCSPEGSGSCSGQASGAYQQNGDAFPATQVDWRYKVGASGEWVTESKVCLSSPAGSDSTWCGSNWIYSTLKLSQLTAGVTVYAQAAITNSDGQGLWINSNVNSGVAASATPISDTVVARIWAGNQNPNRPANAGLTGDTYEFKSSDLSTAASGVFSKYEWDLNDDNVFETTATSNVIVRTTWTKIGTYTVRLRLTSQGGETNTASQSFTIFLSPPAGEPGVSIKNGDSYVNTKQVTLNLVWPEYATAARISNDGGFAASKTQTKDLAASIDWELDDSIKGIYTKVVYVRFNGVADTTKTYSDDIILDTTAPVVESASAAAAAVSGSIDVSLKATDDITGVDKVQIKNGTTTVTKDYDKKLSVTEKELGLTVSASSVRKTDSSTIEIRVSDKAGNWSAYQTLSVYRAGSNTVTTPTVTTPTVTTPTVTTKKAATAKSIATYAKLVVLSTSKVSLKVVSSYAKYCKVSGTTLKGLKAGSCKVTVTVTLKSGTRSSKTVTLKVTK